MFATVVSGRVRWSMMVVVALVALLGSVLAVVSAPQAARAEVTGTGGQYVPVPSNARVFSGATAANTFKTVAVAGVGGLPSSGIGAVSMMITVGNPNGQGQVTARPSSTDPSTLVMIYGAGVGGNTSNTALLAVGDDGSIQIATQTAQVNLSIDVTGYYTSTADGVGAGGLVAMSPTRVASTVTGTGVPKGTLSGGDSITFQVAGANGIPVRAAAVAMSIQVQNTGGGEGWVRPYPTGGDKGTGVLNFVSTKGLSTAMAAQVAIGADGKITIDTPAKGGTIDVMVDVQGYFLPSNPGGGFTPQTGRLADTRSGAGVAANASIAVQVAGARDGVPSVEGGLSAVAITLTAIHAGSDGGYAKVWADGAAEPSVSTVTYGLSNSLRTSTAIVPVGADGKIRIKNASASETDYVVDLQGTYNSLPGGPATTNQTGQRTSATRLPFPVTDQTSASVDVGTGNLLVTTNALSLPGATSSTPIGVAYNSRSTTTANANTMEANRWQYALAAAGDLTANASGVVYTDAAGTAWQFTPTCGQGAFTSPAGLQQTLSRVNTSGTSYEYQLKGWTTNQVIHFNLAGQPTSVVDRNGNQVSFNTSDGYALTTLVSTAGPAGSDGQSGARTATSSYQSGKQTFTQTNGNDSRSVSWTKNADGNITAYTDATGATTTFGYSGSDLTSITAPEGGVTSFTYDANHRVTKVEQSNTTAGSPGTAVTRFSYASDTETQVADPRSDQSATVADAKHTTYTLDGNDLVTKAVDAAGRQQSRTYNAANNGVASSTVGAGATGSTTTNTYGANSSQSLTKSQSSSGSSSSTTYDGSVAANAYQPASTTDSSSNETSYTYSGVGNQLSTTSGKDANAATATLAYNDDGTVKTATAPGNDGNPTTYTYNGDKQLTTVTPPTGTSLGAKDYTYDSFGRVRTETDGRGDTTTFGYDADDRLLTTAFSDGTQTVTNTYDRDGNQLTQSSAGGTITNTYDQRNRLISTINTAGGGSVRYGYDLAGNTVQVIDQHGTVSHEYDPANALTTTTYPSGSGTGTQLYTVDDHGRRTDTWLNATANSDPTQDRTSWQAHQHVDYDSSGKLTRVRAWTDSANQTAVVDVTYCYTAGVAAGADCSGTDAANDRDKLQWSKDNLTGQTTTYGYTNPDGTSSNRLTGITQAGGTDPTNWAFTYDSAGNRTEAKATNATTGQVTTDQKLTYNAVGQISTTGYSYDGTGNLTAAPGQTYTYNGAQQMIQSTSDGITTSYVYAGADMNKLLAQSTAGGAEYDYTYGTTDSSGVPVITARIIAGSGTANVIADPTTGQPLDLQTSDGTTSMWVLDGIGNPTAALTDTGGTAYTVRYDAYGAETVTSGNASVQWQQNPYGYKAGVRSSNTDTGLTKFGYRWQSSATGAWIERDTLDAPLSPSNVNRYGFAGLDPINGQDPNGKCPSIPGNGVCTGEYGSYNASDAFPYAVATCGLVDVYAAAAAISPLVEVAAPVVVGCGAVVGIDLVRNPPWDE